MPKLRSFEPRPGRVVQNVATVWIAAWALLTLAQAWLPPIAAFALSQILAIAGLMLAIFYALTALARMDFGLAGKALLAGLLAAMLLSAFSPSLRVSSSVRLVLARAQIAEAVKAHELGADPRCDCILAPDYAAFRWHRTGQGWRGVMKGKAPELEPLTIRSAPLFGGWRLVDVAHDQ